LRREIRRRGAASCSSSSRPAIADEIEQIEIDPDERISGVIRPLFDKFQELGSARQVLLWAQDQALQLPITRRNNSSVCKIEWRPADYHTVLQILRHPVYAGAYVFGRTTQRTRIVDGRARKTTGHSKPMAAWSVLLRDHHPGYISWEQYEVNQKLISENAHMQRRTERKSSPSSRSSLLNPSRRPDIDQRHDEITGL
jgi:Recombinase